MCALNKQPLIRADGGLPRSGGASKLKGDRIRNADAEMEMKDEIV